MIKLDLDYEPNTKALNYFNKLILEDLKKVCNCWIAGGSIRDYFSKEKIKDIDLFFPNEEHFIKCLSYFGIYKNNSLLESFQGGNNYETKNKDTEIVFQNNNAIKINYKKQTIDIIKHYFESPEETILNFDFTCCSAAIDGKNIYIHDTFFQDLASKRLIINSLPYPVSSLYRLQKYIKKGYTMCSGGLISLAMAISEKEIHMDEEFEAKHEFYPID